MNQVKIFDGQGNLKKIISGKEVEAISLARSIEPLFAQALRLKVPVERKCWCGVKFTTRNKRQIICNKICSVRKANIASCKRRKEARDRKREERGSESKILQKLESKILQKRERDMPQYSKTLEKIST